MRRFLPGLFLVLALTGLLAGCATTPEEEVSTIPWNRPQSWEGTGALGPYAPGATR